MWSMNPNLIWLIAGTVAALTIGTAIRLIALRSAPADLARNRIGSLKVWWVLTLLWSTAALLGQPGAAVLLAIASLIGLREYLRLIGTTASIGRMTIGGLLVCGVVHYALIIGGVVSLTIILFPISLLLMLGAVRSMGGRLWTISA